MGRQSVLILNFGGQRDQLLARRVRGAGVFCEVRPCTISLAEIAEKNPIGIIFTGGQGAAGEQGSPTVDPGIYSLGVPILGIGYGARLIVHQLGGELYATQRHEFAEASVTFDSASPLFKGLGSDQRVWMSFGEQAARLPEGFAPVGGVCTDHAAFEDEARKIFGLQFLPEAEQTENGRQILHNFLFGVCGASGDWTMADYSRQAIDEIRQKVGQGKVLLALSGGVDSSVVAALLSKAVGPQLVCIFVDHGLMRKNEGDEIMAAFKDWELNLIRVDAGQRFLGKLAGVTDPEQKRKIIGEEFIRVFEEEARGIGKVDFLAQGTIYPDVIESGVKGDVAVKSHHNVGGLPDHVDFTDIIEPLRPLFKDEVRALGLVLGLPEYLVWRQPFPGPGLAVRVIGEITPEKLEILREADYIFRTEIAKAGLDREIGQYFAVITDLRSVGVKSEGRTYEYTLALRAVTTGDFMTAQWAQIPYEVLGVVSARIVDEVRGVNRVVYDITGKPPATIEWE
ncbi:MAG: glutamine-hydrolyzing GMP synthase [Oscillospiraceae bacterium]|nr:glutamine-hydrolyzing GMP synthase [Oscillospiraceae bacterium]